MTSEQKKNINLGASYLKPFSPEDIRRRDEWIENQLPQVLDLALKQADELYITQQQVNAMRQLPGLVESVSQWGIQKEITGPYGKATLETQAKKMIEEAHETRDAVELWEDSKTAEDASDARDEIIDGIGDTTVTLILLSDLLGVPFAQCLQSAYDEIKGRTGKMVDGVFVKDGGKSEPSTLGMP